MIYYTIGSCLTFALLVFKRARRKRSCIDLEPNFGPLILLSIAFIAAFWPIFLLVAVFVMVMTIFAEILVP